MTKKFIMFILILAILTLIIGCGGKTDMSNYNDDKFEVGQIWSYANRPNEDKSTITILKVESYENLGIVIHIAIDNLHIKDSDGKEHDNISHLPFSKDALNKSITTLLNENQALPDFDEGYDRWKSAFDAKEAGIWSVQVSEAVEYMEEAMNKGK
jgi:hypothetical protein